MERVTKYFSRDHWAAGRLNKLPGYVLARIKGEAFALHAARPENSWMRDQACVVIGYVEAFEWYAPGEFPWDHVIGRLRRMRHVIARAEASRKTVPKAIAQPHQHEVRYEGRWVSRIWYARHVKQAA